MARSYGRFTTSIYRDEDFRALTAAEQGVYFMLGLQPEVTAAGTLPLTLRRWSAMSADMTREDLSETLSVLVSHDHLLIDWDTEELLITKFVKWDGGIGNEKRRPVILEAACAIESERIRHRIAHEIAKLGYSDMASRIGGEGASEAISGFDRVVVTEGESIPQPPNATPEPSTATPKGEPSGASAEPPAWNPDVCKNHQPDGTDEACGNCRRARMNNARAKQQHLEDEVARRKARAAAIGACEMCDEQGRRLHPVSRLPLGACDHQPQLEESA